MSIYEDYDGSFGPNNRPVSAPKRSRQTRRVWLILILLYMSGCSYWGWQVFLRPDGEFAEGETSIIVAETESLVADAHAAQIEGQSTLMKAVDPLPAAPPSPPAAPTSKPASVKAKKPKRNGRPLSKMEAETGLIYETDRTSPASKSSPQHADHDELGTQTERADPDASVEIDYGNDHTIHQSDIPPASKAKRGVIMQETEAEEEPLPDPEIEPEPLPFPEQSPNDLPPQINIVIDPHPPIERPARPVVYVEPTPVISVPPPFHPEFDYAGAFVVQIASFANVEVACSVWDNLRVEHPRLFGDAETIVRPHRTGSGRILHRLRVGAFAKRRHAVDWCLAYREVGGECFVTRRS